MAFLLIVSGVLTHRGKKFVVKNIYKAEGEYLVFLASLRGVASEMDALAQQGKGVHSDKGHKKVLAKVPSSERQP